MDIFREGDRGPNVELIQSTLKKLGFYNGNIDGIFGPKTKAAVIRFQKEFNLKPDGIVGFDTWNALFSYINGYSYYVIKPGDTLYSIVKKFNTNINFLLVANPMIDVNNLKIGDVIIVPFGNVVPTDISYTYKILDINILALRTIYPFLEFGNIGNSVLGKQIPYIRIGRGQREVLYTASIHANEWITSVLLMKFVENFCKAYVLDRYIFGYRARDLFEGCSLYIVPMVNPDAVEVVTEYVGPGNEIYEAAKRVADRYPNIPFPSGWKANIKGVDLNLQFPARWEEAREIKYSEGFTTPAPRDYVGLAPLTQPEAIALYNFTNINNFRLTISYHTQGKEIYWRFLYYLPEDSFKIAMEFSRVSGYTLSETPYRSSFAGYRDWFIQDFNRPGFTIEAGEGVSPLPISQFDTIYADNEGILVLGMVL